MTSLQNESLYAAGGLSGTDLAEVVLESSHDGIYITDGQANTLLINKSYENISGLSRQDMLGKNMRDLVMDGIISASGTLQVLASREPVTMEQTFKTNKRAVITSAPVFNDRGEIVLVVTNVRDITELHLVKKELQKKESLNRKYYKELESIRQELVGGEDIVAVDKTMMSILRLAKKVSAIKNPVLLTGDSGTGKKRLAKFIHASSDRRKEPFLVCDLGTIPPEHMERELLGLGDQTSLLELADGGTLYIGDIQLLPMNAQSRLSRFLNDGVLEPTDSSALKKLDVRIIASSGVKSDHLLTDHLLRENLYYILSVFVIELPPLRERREDILPLTELFLKEFNQQFATDKKFDQEARDRLTLYDWPGNVQELRNLVQRAVIISEGSVIGPDDLFINATVAAVKAQFDELPETINLKEVLERIELGYMNKAFERYGNTRAAAKSLGMDASTFVRKRQKHIQAGLLQNSSK